MIERSLTALPEILSGLAVTNVAIIYDPAIADTRPVVDVISDIRAGMSVHTITAEPGEPAESGIDKIARDMRLAKVDAVVGIGGGSVLDSAKMVAAITKTRDSIGDYALAAKPFPDALPCIAVPTTSGTGSEVTRTAIFADPSGRKLWVWGDALLPVAVVLDPTLTAGLPSALTTATGLDAVVHAVEAVSGNRTSAQIETYALDALSLIMTALPTAMADPENLDARSLMQQAAMQAGHAIEFGGTGVAHAIGHGLATVAKVPHGLAVSMALQAAMPMLVDRAPERFSGIVGTFGCSAPDLLPETLATFFADVGFEQALADLSGTIPPTDDVLRAVRAPENSPMIENTPMEISDTDLGLLCERTLELWGGVGT